MLAGGFVALLVFFGADFIATTIMHLDMSAYALRVLAPCILIVALLGVLRGFFQGIGSMIPTAISQVIEQIINAVVSIAGAYVLLNAGKAVGKREVTNLSVRHLPQPEEHFGTVLGAFSALVFVGLVFLAYNKVFKRKMRRDHSKKTRKL